MIKFFKACSNKLRQTISRMILRHITLIRNRMICGRRLHFNDDVSTIKEPNIALIYACWS